MLCYKHLTQDSLGEAVTIVHLGPFIRCYAALQSVDVTAVREGVRLIVCLYECGIG